MHSTIIIIAIFGSAVAAPTYFLSEEPHVYHSVPLSSKSTYTHSSQVVDHGSTFIHSPILHTPVVPIAHTKTTITKANQIVNHGGSTVLHPVHTYETLPLHDVYHFPSTTVTKSNHIVNHGGSAVVHAPVVSLAHTRVVPVVHAPVHTPVVYHSSPLVSLKTGDSAITHQSSTVHETVPVVRSSPFIAVHH